MHELKKWIKDSWLYSCEHDRKVVMLIPSRTDTKYWHDYVMKADEIWFIKGRLKFDDQKGSAPFPSAIVIFNAKKNKQRPPLLKSVDIRPKEL